MDERTHSLQVDIVLELLGDQVLDGLDVMIRRRLDLLDATRVPGVELVRQLVEVAADDRGQGPEIVDFGPTREELHPADLGEGAQPNQPELAEQLPVAIGASRVAAVERGDGGERREIHDCANARGS